MPRKIAVSYSRLSKEDYEKTNIYSSSIYNQLAFIKSYAQNIGIEIEKEYVDDGISGINYDRPSFKKLKKDIESGLIAVVITKDISRLGRNFIETSYLIRDYFPQNNVRYIAINDNFDSANQKENNILLDIKTLINDYYVKESSQKRKQIADSKTAKSHFIGPLAPYGYKVVKKDNIRSLQIDEDTAKIVKYIFSEIANGKAKKEVAENLNKAQIPSPIISMHMTPGKGKKYYYDWSDKIIYRILNNKTYLGKIVKRTSIKKDYHDKKRTYIPLKDRETIPSPHPAIITKELFEKTRLNLKPRKTHEKSKYSGLFNNLVICGECGNIMTACRKNKNGKIIYHFECTKTKNRARCPNRTITENKVKRLVINKLKIIIKEYVSPSYIYDRTLSTIIKTLKINSKIDNLKLDIEFHNKRIKDLYLKKALSSVKIEEFIKEKEKETSLKLQSEKSLRKLLKLQNNNIWQQDIIKKYQEFLKNEENIIRLLIKNITIYNDNTIELSFKFNLNLQKQST